MKKFKEKDLIDMWFKKENWIFKYNSWTIQFNYIEYVDFDLIVRQIFEAGREYNKLELRNMLGIGQKLD